MQTLFPDEIAGLSALQTAGKLPLPDGASCKTTLAIDPGPVAVYWCDLAVAIASQPDGERANYAHDLASGDFNAQNISYFLPTRKIKAFHPRSAVMALYSDAVMDVKDDVDRFS